MSDQSKKLYCISVKEINNWGEFESNHPSNNPNAKMVVADNGQDALSILANNPVKYGNFEVEPNSGIYVRALYDREYLEAHNND